MNTVSRVFASMIWKVLGIGVLSVLLLIPLALVLGLVEEREARRDEVVQEISAAWGQPQAIVGPMLVLPYTTTRTWVNSKTGEETRRDEEALAFFVPEEVSIAGSILPERRARGPFGVVVYSLPDLVVSGRFAAPDLAGLRLSPAAVQWERALLTVWIPDTRSLQRGSTLAWGGREVAFESGSGVGQRPGIHVPLAIAGPWTAGSTEFRFSLSLRGSSELMFAALGESVTADLRSTWAHPGFTGAFLPSRRDIGNDGFQAQWQVARIATGLPRAFRGADVPGDAAIAANSFGLRLVIPADAYQQTVRAVKYGFLLIGLTFVAYLLFEVLTGLSLHPLQYLLVGLALCLFFLLFLAVSEHLGFVPAYLLASLAVIGAVTGYSAAILRSRARAGTVGGMLATLYAVLFVVLTSEDYALLLGSIVLFTVLALFMYLTRRFDWSRGATDSRLPPVPVAVSDSGVKEGRS